MHQAFGGHKTARYLVLGIVIALSGLVLPTVARAQNVVVAGFADRTKTRLGAKARIQIARELKKQGARVVSVKQYLRLARRNRIKAKQATQPWAIKKLSKNLRLAGVIKGSVVRGKGRLFLRVSVIDSAGKLRLKKAFRLRKPNFPKRNAAQLARQIMAKLDSGAGARVAKPIETRSPERDYEPPPAAEPEPAPRQDALPAWARQPEPAQQPQRTAESPSQPVERAAPSIKTQPQKRSRRRVAGPKSVPDIRLTLGSTFHFRSGLEPVHKASLYPGVRVDGHLFLGSMADVAVLRNIGFGGMFDMALGLKYGYINEDNNWDASQLQWRAEMLYRWALDVSLNPTFVFKIGYGSLSSTIDAAASATNATSVSYKAPYAGFDFHVTLIDPYLRFFASSSALLSAQAGEDLSGTGWGFNLSSGLDFALFELMSVGLGYEMTQMKFGEKDARAAFSDSYHALFLRIGFQVD